MQRNEELIQKVNFFYETAKRMGRDIPKRTIRNRIKKGYTEQEILTEGSLRKLKHKPKAAIYKEPYKKHCELYLTEAITLTTFYMRVIRNGYTLEEAIYTPSKGHGGDIKGKQKRTKEMYLQNQLK